MSKKENSFKIDWNKEFIYFLGYLWADGYINRKRIAIEILEEDGINIIEFFNKIEFLKFNIYKRKRIKYKPSMTMYFSNAKFYDDFLSKYYINKSEKSPIELIRSIPSHLRRYFYLGLFDGDGCFYISKNFITKQFCLASSYNQDWSHMINLFKNLNITQYEIKKITHKKGSKSSNIRIKKYSEILSLYNYLYPLGYEIGLKRKFNKCELIVRNAPRYSVNKSTIDFSKLLEEIKSGLNIDEISKIYNCGYNKIYNLCIKNDIYIDGFNKKRIKRLKKEEYMNFEESTKYIKEFYIKSKKEWNLFCKEGKRPINLPSNPYQFYKNNGWISWGNWLGF